MRRKQWIGCMIVGAVWLGWTSLALAAPPESPAAVATPPLEQAPATVGAKPYPVMFEATRRATLSSERAGVLDKLTVDVGSYLKKDAVVASVDAGDSGMRRKRSETAMAHLDRKIQELTKLNKSGLATNEALETVRMERDLAQADIAVYGREIAQSVIHAPYACVVVRRRAQTHEWVTAGQPVVDVVNLEEMRAVANIPSHLAVRLKPGTTHALYVHDLNAEVTGKVLAVAPEVDERSNTAQVVWTIQQAENRLLPGMKGEVRLGE